jgi:hypothetical protein
MNDQNMVDWEAYKSFRTMLAIFSWNESIHRSHIGPWLHDYWLNHPPLIHEQCFLNPDFMISGMLDDFILFRKQMTLGSSSYGIPFALWKTYWDYHPVNYYCDNEECTVI